jgi:hypothetical protein
VLSLVVIVLMVWFPLLRLEEVVAFECCAVAAIVTAGRLAATAMLALAVKNLRRDVTSSVEVVSSFKGSSPTCGQDVLVTLDHPIALLGIRLLSVDQSRTSGVSA